MKRPHRKRHATTVEMLATSPEIVNLPIVAVEVVVDVVMAVATLAALIVVVVILHGNAQKTIGSAAVVVAVTTHVTNVARLVTLLENAKTMIHGS